MSVALDETGNFSPLVIQMIRVVEDDAYLEVDAVWAVGQVPPVPSTEDNEESENEASTSVEADKNHNPPLKKSSVPLA